jgi:hypothetical protein
MAKTTVKVTKITNGIKVGTVVPKQVDGNVGFFAEDKMKANGYTIDDGAGPDFKGMNVEMKTRKNTATAAHTVGKMTLDNIKITPFKDSTVCSKIQHQYRVKYDDEVFHEVTSEKVYDFTDPLIQAQIEEGFETARTKIINGATSNYIRGSGIGYFERQGSTNSYAFRIPNSQMKYMESVSCSSKHFQNLFE